MVPNEAPNDLFKLTISGYGVDVDRMIDGKTLAVVMACVMGADNLVAPVSLVSSTSSPAASGAAVQTSLREFLDQAHAKRKPDQIVAIGHYITQIEAQADFSRDEVKERFSVAREPMPANFPRDFLFAERKGMIAKVHGKEGRYYITRTGLHAIDNKFVKVEAK